MSNPVTISRTSNSKMLQAMVGIGIMCGLFIVLTYEGTLPRIERLRAEALQNAIYEVLPGVTNTVAFTYENNTFTPASEDDQNVVYAGYDNEGNFKGVAIAAGGQGYADIIRILYGYDPKKEAVIGFYVLESKETPGLGDKIEKDPTFLQNFEALDVALNTEGELKNPVQTVKRGEKTNPWEVDGITGATISSRAIGNILNESMSEWAPRIYSNKNIFEQANVKTQ